VGAIQKGIEREKTSSWQKTTLRLLSVAHMDALSSSTSEHKAFAFRSRQESGWGNKSAPLRWGAEKPSSFAGCFYAYLRVCEGGVSIGVVLAGFFFF